MSDVVIRAERLGKKYLIGHQAKRERYTALRDVVGNAARGLARSVRDMIRGNQIVAGDEIEEFWALKDVSFEVRRGEVLGIIGRNGAGKSTLLKILSRITEPSAGRVELKGRIASLLEVGTGFHSELTGRENIFLNGAILGMSRAEIKRRFDEIVAFAEVEKFLDTPVKRYSSGMYVRLAFAVAAHLEPEILVVDEVLAVGDAEFQRKCLGKMQDVAGHGRTVLFVSHNMGAVAQLCSRAIVLRDGRIESDDDVSPAIEKYINHRTRVGTLDTFAAAKRKGAQSLRFRCVTFFDGSGKELDNPRPGKPLVVRLEFEGVETRPRPARIGIAFEAATGEKLFICANEAAQSEPVEVGAGSTIECVIPELPLAVGRYGISLFIERAGLIEDWLEDALTFEVPEGSFFETSRDAPIGWEGKTVLVRHAWRQVSELRRLGKRLA